MFDWLKVFVGGGKTKPKKAMGRKPVEAQNRLVVDSRNYPITDISPKGVVAGDFDGSLVQGQNAKVTVVLNDACGKVSFATTVVVDEAKEGGYLRCSWGVLPLEVDSALKTWLQRRRALKGHAH